MSSELQSFYRVFTEFLTQLFLAINGGNISDCIQNIANVFLTVTISHFRTVLC